MAQDAATAVIQKVGQQSVLQNIARTAADFVPQIKIYHTVEKIAFAVVIILCIILMIIGIVLFSKKNVGAGVWVTGSAIALGSFALWWYFFETAPVQPKYGSFEGGSKKSKKVESDEFENIGLEDFKPDEWTE